MFLALNDIPWSEALSNTAIGIGTVFIMLIFISLIISCFGIFPKLEKSMAAKKTAGLEDKAAPLSAKDTAKKEANPMDDAELVAVITAAVYEASAAAGLSTSRDNLVVRSIRRAR